MNEPSGELELPDWVSMADPAQAHPAAHAAWIHATTRCALALLWFVDEFDPCIGLTEAHVLHPGGGRRCVGTWTSAQADAIKDGDGCILMQSATRAAEDLAAERRASR